MAAETADPRYRCGTLVYTRAGLFMVFTYLLWGDFCFSLMESVWPVVLPLILKNEGAPNSLVALVITTIPSAMNFFMNPILGTFSDRCRTKSGRRIPFLLTTAPFITLFLVLLGYSRALGQFLFSLIYGVSPTVSQTAVVVGVICLLIICFRFFELIVNTIFWYLFNDVVPSAFIGRFLGFFRIVGSLAGALFNFFLFRYAESHTSAIFLVVGVLYGISFVVICLKVKEGNYPPPKDLGGGRSWSIRAYVGGFFSECFGHRLFRLIFGYSVLVGINGAMSSFLVFLAFSIGLGLDEIGKVAGFAALLGVVIMYPMGVLVDRFHPLRIMMAAKIGICAVLSMQFVFLFFEFSKEVSFWIYAVVMGLSIPMNVANGAATLPMYMKVFPQAQFGQFCAANAMCGAFGTMCGGLTAGLFLDFLRLVFPEGLYYYRFIPLWNVFFLGFALMATISIYREWVRLGGDKHFRVPGRH